MTAMVCFRAGGNTYAISVWATLGVRSASNVVRLPSQADDVVGLIPGDPALSVVSPLAASGDQVLVVAVGEHRYGLLVDEVTEVCDIDESSIGPTPGGQDRRLVTGTIERGSALILVVDPSTLADRYLSNSTP